MKNLCFPPEIRDKNRTERPFSCGTCDKSFKRQTMHKSVYFRIIADSVLVFSDCQIKLFSLIRQKLIKRRRRRTQSWVLRFFMWQFRFQSLIIMMLCH